MTQNDALPIASLVKRLELKEGELNKLNEDVKNERYKRAHHYTVAPDRMKAWLTSDVESLRAAILHYLSLEK